MRFPSFAGLVLLAAATSVQAISTISVLGNKFFNEDGSQFFIKGVAYQLTPDDPLLDKDQCSRDASLMEELGANSIRVYHVDPSQDHTDCMDILANAGIYLLVDLDTFDTAILADSPWWNHTQYVRFTEVMDEFQKYDNTLAFFVGNEVINQANQSLAAPFIRGAARDVKTYRANKNYRDIPVGYSAADIAELRPMLQDYLTCGGNSSDTVDFFALNSYEWCGTVNYETSGYANLESEAVNFPVPIFFSETGCNVAPPRTFEDQAAIFGEEMVNDWSGAIIYEWIQEANDYGLVSYGPAGADSTSYAVSGTPTPIAPDFTNLKNQWATLTPTGVKSSEMDTATLSTRACPSSTASTVSGAWLVQGNAALPTLGETLLGTNYVTSVPTGTNTASTSSGTSSSSSSSAKSPASPKSGVTKMGAALVGVSLLFMVWM